MAFGGNFGASANLVPFGIVKNIKGEQATGYDAAGNIKFTTASGREYTPSRVDTLIILGIAVQGSPPLGAVVPGTPDQANADVGVLVTAVAVANQHGLPANFGPGRGKWAGPTGVFGRLRVTASASMDAPVVSPAVVGTGGIDCASLPIVANDVLGSVRNYNAVDLETLFLTVECLHSVQG